MCWLKKICWVLLFLGFVLEVNSQPLQSYRLVAGQSFSESKNFYLLTLFESLPEVHQALLQDEIFEKLAKEKITALGSAAAQTSKNASDYSKRILFTPGEISLVSQRLRDLYKVIPSLRTLFSEHLVPSGTYQLQKMADPAEWLARAWEQDARAVNHAITVYAGGEKPNYPAIDSLGDRVDSRSFLDNIQGLDEVVKAEVPKEPLFFQVSMVYALRAIEMNGMSHAGEYEPMQQLENRTAYEQIKQTKWNDFPYPVIVVPGAGPDSRLDSISSGGILRSHLAAAAIRAKLAPFILVSGGNVHPYKTPFNEAMEMKKCLIRLGVPASAILIDPHARHTTTNMRNAVRIMFRYGIPVDRPSLTVTTPSQSEYIFAPMMQQRCMKELGYSPYANGKRLSATTAEFLPHLLALQIDEDEPLDP